MEKQLENVLDDVLAKEGVTGCLFADHLGLCLGAKGDISKTSSGMIVALADIASRLEPDSPRSPVISLENDNKTCLIKRSGTVTGVIFKNNTVNINI